MTSAIALSPHTMAYVPLTSTALPDNESISTTMAENHFLTLHDEVKEYVVKFMFQPNTSSQNTKMAQTLRHTPLHHSSLPRSTNVRQLLENHERIPLLKTFDAYLRHFKFQFVKANSNNKSYAIYLAFHRIRSSLSISEIHKNLEVAAILSKQNTCLTVHLWKEAETQITNLGFYVIVDPSIVTKEYFEERVHMKISKSTRRDKKKIPQFHCGFSSSFVIEEGGTRTSTKAYNYSANNLMFHQIRHRDMNAYKNAIRKQNSFLAKSCVVPIKGVTMEVYPTKFHKSLACSTLSYIKTMLIKAGGAS